MLWQAGPRRNWESEDTKNGSAEQVHVREHTRIHTHAHTHTLTHIYAYNVHLYMHVAKLFLSVCDVCVFNYMIHRRMQAGTCSDTKHWCPPASLFLQFSLVFSKPHTHTHTHLHIHTSTHLHTHTLCLAHWPGGDGVGCMYEGSKFNSVMEFLPPASVG